MSKLETLLLGTSILLYGFLTVFSYAYVDLNLTLSQNQLVLNFVGQMQQLGYYQRPLATSIYILFTIFAFFFFSFNLWLFFKSKVGLRYLKISTIANTLILIFAYPFLSSDLFNYLFDAKIILNYGANPYTHRPLDFPNDDWLRFMRWTHRYSPYGPLWLGMSAIPAALGFGKFILNFFAFKIFIGVFHLVNSYLIFRILRKVNPKYALFGCAFYALNPLFLIEGIVNAHNDIILTTSMIASIYFLVAAKPYKSLIITVAGTLIKYIPILNLPWLIWAMFALKKNLPVNLPKLIALNLATMAAFTFLFSSFRITVPFVSSGATQVQFQPWYLFWTLPFVALIPRINLVAIAIALAFGASFRYLPFLYFGDWSQPITLTFMRYVTLAPPALVALVVLIKTTLVKNEKS